MEVASQGSAFRGFLVAIAKEYEMLEAENRALKSRVERHELVADERKPSCLGGPRALCLRNGGASGTNVSAEAVLLDKPAKPAQHATLGTHALIPPFKQPPLPEVPLCSSSKQFARMLPMATLAGTPATKDTFHDSNQRPVVDWSPLSEISDDQQQMVIKSKLSSHYEDLDPATARCRVLLRLGVSTNGVITAFQLYQSMLNLGVCKFPLFAWDAFLKDVQKSYEEAAETNTARRLSRFSIRTSTTDIANTMRLGQTVSKVPVMALVAAMNASRKEKVQRMSPEHHEMLAHLCNVLFSSDANILIAELTNVQIDDLCSTYPTDELLERIEPFVAIAVILNGFTVGCQIEKAWEEWPGWEWINASFTLVYFIEFFFRIWKQGLRQMICGREMFWGVFDMVILGISLFDLCVAFLSSLDVDFVGVLRIVRMCRLVRLVRIFRLRIMRDLTLMVHGLVSGLKTLAWAFVLLLALIYIMAVCMVSILKNDTLHETNGEPWQPQLHFVSVPSSMLVIFRCFTGDCVDGVGHPIIPMLADRYGWPFVAAYLVAFIIVTFGLFNLIISIYVENTMTAARIDDASTARQVRVAHKTRELLAKFCLAQTTFDEVGSGGIPTVEDVKRKLAVRDTSRLSVEDSEMVVTKEIFLIAIQDSSVQKLMDDLDIPSDRAYLFDIFDTKGCGKLLVTELVHGLLKVRGGPKKSDIVAVLLAVQAIRREVVDLKRVIRPKDGLSNKVLTSFL